MYAYLFVPGLCCWLVGDVANLPDILPLAKSSGYVTDVAVIPAHPPAKNAYTDGNF